MKLDQQDLINEEKVDKIFEELDLMDQTSDSKKGKFDKFKYFFKKRGTNLKEFMGKSPLLSYSIKRVIYAFITLYIAISIIFIMLSAVTTDSAYLSDVNLDKLGIEYGSDDYFRLLNNKKKLYGAYGSVFQQLFIYLRNITPIIPKEIIKNPSIVGTEVVGDKETVWFYLGAFMNKASGGVPGTSVIDAFKKSIPVSFTVGGIAVTLSYLLGVPLGILAAKNKDKATDSAINGFSLVITAIPALVLISLLYKMSIYGFSANGTYSNSGLGTKIWPVIGVMLLIMPLIIVNTRRYVIDEMTSDYTKFAISKGLSSRYVFYVHIFRNASIRLVKTIPEVFIITLFGSSILVERHWSIDGMSKFILNGVSNKDTYVVLGYIFVSASAGVFSSLAGDLLLAIMDPRIKLTK
ncbi:oligopeptide ABC transporter permease [Spiroplasma litorale]|uniref:Oligopeptide ABC transporter permease n=1 Tax=Spiroplasma litorale TaxID=216942 RepID=A0A0K1W1E0_9MOLU|nr:oligopeptide ABC transporter permease OppB [Spiroplasma litorale]AKX33907.1 oligopeptide ABC transporter permease [Spiroplasma litorale]